MKLRSSVLVVVVFVAMSTASAGAGIATSLALFTTSQTDANTLRSASVFSGTRTTAAFSVRDASGGGAPADSSSSSAFDDGLSRTTGAWSTAFSGTRYLEYDLNSPLPTGLGVSSASFNFKFASTGAGTGCFYFETRTASGGSVLGTYGGGSSPIGCVTGTTQQSFSTSIVSSVTSSDIANGLRIRVYGTESGGAGWSVGLATVSGSTSAVSFTLYRTQLVDRSSGSPTTDVWGPVAQNDGFDYQTSSAWTTSFGPSRYVEFRFPAYVPSGSTITSAELRHSYRPQASGAPLISYVDQTSASSSVVVSGASLSVPAGTADGNLLIAAIATGGNSTFGVPGGWTQITNSSNGNGTVGVWYRVASAEPAAYAWTFGGAGKRFAAFMATYSGVDTTTPIDTSAFNAQSGSGTSITAPTISPSWAPDMLLFVAGAGDGVTYTKDAQMSTERTDLLGASGNNGASVTLDEQLLVTSGATGSRTATASGAPGRYVATSIALRPGTPGANACYYLEVYEGSTLRGTHGSGSSPLSCNASASTNQVDVVTLTELTSAARANDCRIRMFFKEAAAQRTLHDRVTLAITYSTP